MTIKTKPDTHRSANFAMTSLNGLWDFSFLGAIDLNHFQPDDIDCCELMPVPAAYDATLKYAGKRGAACYRKTLSIPARHPAKLYFGAISMWSRIFIDGELLHESTCGYAPIELKIEPSESSQRELLVLADNRFDFVRLPMHEEPFDFYQYGGIIRDVSLRILPRDSIAIDYVHVTPTEAYRDGEVSVKIGITGTSPESLTVVLQFDNGATTQVDVLAFKSEICLNTKVPQPRVWTPDSPKLHTVNVYISGRDASIGRQIRFGLRKIEAFDGKLWLNGEAIELRGYNRHEWHPNYGPSTPYLQLVQDLQILRDLGCNFVRGSHYPQDQRFLDLCDEMGILVWEENLGWGQRERTLTNEQFARNHRESLQAMMHASHNHPSIIIWGFLNEAGSDEPYSRPIFEESVALIRATDPSRLVSFASMFAMKDLHFDLVDLIAINIYPGWYGCEQVERPLELIAPHMQKCFEHLSSDELKDKPVMVSEIGAEALYGWREPHNDFYTEEYQAQYLKIACEEARRHERCSGIAIWHFSDVRTYSGGLAMKRPRTFNNKGTLDEYRRPKAAYQTVKSVFTQK